ncbi:NAD(P)/FAD-dependent oxidoreductase [Azohydromonas caseinilytica]|uniref:FAD-binding oxidoreductase n=1 Tax=Azohydromonas caseinilytica TaxID=2728836 RepID=A0A848FGF7_9BURK|nr:FAD-dependent oxidoreductase [Azohydromonas caseinilytica]NML17935.1 FAD-binding oxidoreductase [Azohydromonas caseinilytica]
MDTFDFAVIGAGIAGASAAYEISARASVLLLERESQPGYHTTGRSAALFMESYGTPAIRALTRASRAFFDAPAPVFGAEPLLAPRGVLHVAQPDQGELLEAAWRELSERGGGVRRVSRDEMLAMVPCLRPEATGAGLAEDSASDIDVHALHQGYLRGLRQHGGQVRNPAEVVALSRGGGMWTLRLADGEEVRARHVVNAAGAWADVIATLAGARPIGLEPRRRSAFTFSPPAGVDASRWPAVVGIDESYYFKPDAGQLLGSPANADPVAPHDVVPEELDVALGIYRIEQATTMSIRRPGRTWAGLRSFVADGDMVIGWDGQCEGFFWLAAQGGYGIQSAPGAALLARSLLLGEPLPEPLAAQGVDGRALSPGRLR